MVNQFLLCIVKGDRIRSYHSICCCRLRGWMRLAFYDALRVMVGFQSVAEIDCRKYDELMMCRGISIIRNLFAGNYHEDGVE